MTTILIIGATGSIGRVVAPELLHKTNAGLVLASRRPSSIAVTDPRREKTLRLDVTNDRELTQALTGVDIVFASLAGRMAKFAKHLVKVMEQTGPKRLIFIATMGIYQEIPARLGKSPNPYHNLILRKYRKAADIIEDSSLDYTIIRPGWLDDGPADYELTKKGEPFGGHDVSRYAIADLVARIAAAPAFASRESLGINRPQVH